MTSIPETIRLRAVLLPLTLLLFLPVPERAPQKSLTPIDVTLCDLLAEPAKYDGAFVRVRGQISIAFEDFTLIENGCPRKSDKGAVGVWLEYGGDESSPTIYCCGDHSRRPGQDIEVNGRPIRLTRNSQLDEFRKRISAARQSRPDGLLCQGRECYLYEVTATITGHFLAQTIKKDGEMVGYGHLGMFHLLFIERVSKLDVRRTHVPAGGVYGCTPEKWEAPRSTIEDIVRAYRECSGRSSCNEAIRRALVAAARHWDDPVEQVESWGKGVGEEAEYRWSSPDLLTTYTLKFPYTNPNVKTSREEFSATRAKCIPAIRPLPKASRVTCDTSVWGMEDPKPIAAIAQEEFDRGSAPWRTELEKAGWHAVLENSAKRSIGLSPRMEVESCRAGSVQQDDQAFCQWLSRDGMQAAHVTLIRYGFLAQGGRTKDQTVWVALGGSLSTCKAD